MNSRYPRENFAIAGILDFEENENGLTRAIVSTKACSAELYLQGAHLMQWHPADNKPVLFLSERSEFRPDEILVKNDAEAISLLTRGKSLLRVGMPKQIIENVMNALRQEYLDTGRYVEADQTAKDAYALYPPPVVQSVVYKVEDDIALLDAVGKRKYPSAWASQDAEKAQRAKVLLAYEQYVEALRGFAATRKVNDAPGWAAAIIVRHKPTTARSAIGTIFELRDRLISLTDERAVIEIGCRLPFKK